MTNDDAREAALTATKLPGFTDLLTWRAAWDACMAHLRATGQLCTAEDAATLERCARELDTWIAAGDGDDVGTISNVLGELQAIARRAKGGSDVG